MVKANFIYGSRKKINSSLPFKAGCLILFLVLLPAFIFGAGCNADSNDQQKHPAVLPYTLQPKDSTLPREKWLELYREKASAQVEREYMEYSEAAAKYKEKIGYETMVNSATALEIILPAGFDKVINGVEIGPFLRSRNKFSKQNGFDFADFMGKRVVLYTCSSQKDADLVLLIYNGKIIGAWKDATGEDFHFIRLNTSTP